MRFVSVSCLVLLLFLITIVVKGAGRPVKEEFALVALEAPPDAGVDDTFPDGGIDGGVEVVDLAPETASVAQPPGGSSQRVRSFETHTAPVHMSVFANPVAALLWGGIVGMELGRKITAGLRLRIPNAGLLPYTLEGDDSEFEWGLGGSLGVRFYRYGDARPNGFYFGLLAEYYHVTGRRPSYDWQLGYLAPAIDVGYRRIFGHVFLSLGGTLGCFINIYRKRAYDFGWTETGDPGLPLPLTELTLEIGWIGAIQ